MNKDAREFLLDNYLNSVEYKRISKNQQVTFVSFLQQKKSDIAIYKTKNYQLEVRHNITKSTYFIGCKDRGKYKKDKNFNTIQSFLDSLNSVIESLGDCNAIIKREKSYNKITDLRLITKLKLLKDYTDEGMSISKASKVLNVEYSTAKRFLNNELEINI